MTAILAVVVMLLAQVINLSAWEAHIINVKAGVKNDVPMIWPAGRQFCDQSPVSITLTSDIPTSTIYYTLDGTDPECGVSGALYEGPFNIQESLTIKARACHDGIESAVMAWEFEVELEFCQEADHLLINKVYSDVGRGRGRESRNEWLELYNPTDEDIDLGGWQFCNHYRCAEIKPGRVISSQGFAILTRHHTTEDIWQIPSDVPVLDVNDYLGPGIFFYNPHDQVILKNPDSVIVDQMNYGEPNPGWPNYNAGTWEPGIEPVEEGNVLARLPSGQDTDTPDDWQELGMPEISLTSPADCETWWPGETYDITWQAENANGPDEALAIDIYFTLDKGKHWLPIALGEANDGVYAWAIPSELYDWGICRLNWDKEWIKIVATGPENFMIQSSDESRHNCCNKNKAGQNAERKNVGGHKCQAENIMDFDFLNLFFNPGPPAPENKESDSNTKKENVSLPTSAEYTAPASSTDESGAATTTDDQASSTEESQNFTGSDYNDEGNSEDASSTMASAPDQGSASTSAKKEEETSPKEESGEQAKKEEEKKESPPENTEEKPKEEEKTEPEDIGGKKEEEKIINTILGTSGVEESVPQEVESPEQTKPTKDPPPAEPIIINTQTTADE